MSVPMFDRLLSTAEMVDVFDDQALLQAMLDFEGALAAAQAASNMMPESAARAIGSACRSSLYDARMLVDAGRRAGSLAIPLVKELTRTVALADQQAANHVHAGSTSQDVLDTAMVLVTRNALELLDAGLARLIDLLLDLAEQHAATPVLARTLMQAAQVTSFGFKLSTWAAALVRARTQLRASARRALQLQLGGAVGTLSAMQGNGAQVGRHMAAALGLGYPTVAWHTQRDEWVRLGLEVAVLSGSLGKIGTDLALMAQGEIGELAEPSGPGRGGSSAMPNKRNPVASMVALAGATRAPHRAGALLSAMGQQHERGLGNWQAELAEWPGLFLSAHGALAALAEAIGGLQVDRARMRANIDAQGGLVYAEALAGYLARWIGRPAAHAMLEDLARQAMASGRDLCDVAADAIEGNGALREKVQLDQWQELFDPDAAAAPAAALARAHVQSLREYIKEEGFQ
jgi:3-carboxy-cis,cis-muconate cycloisomerase